jgi:hypothetical protein
LRFRNVRKCAVFSDFASGYRHRGVWHAPCNIGWRPTEEKNRGESTVSIQKKSLINTLKSAKKANIVREDVTVSGATASPVKMAAAAKRVAPAMKTASKTAPAMKTASKTAPAKKLASKQAPAVKF